MQPVKVSAPLALVIGILLLGPGCRKDTMYTRMKYLGNYTFSIHKTWAYGIPSDWITGDTTYTEEGDVGKGIQDDAVEIKTPSFDVQAVLHEDGTLEGLGNLGFGEFPTTSSITFTLKNISPAGSTTTYITGTKH